MSMFRSSKPVRELVRSLSSQKDGSDKLILFISSAGLLLLLFLTFTLPFNQGLFSRMFTRPASHAMMLGPVDNCMINGVPSTVQMAFCDQFILPATGAQRGRGGDLDTSRWSFARASQAVNPSQGMVNDIPQVNAQFCKIQKLVAPDNDSFFCGLQFGEPNHWMESMNDGEQYVVNSAKITQPFDFAGRTGVISFDVDAHTLGTHDIWPEVWITDQPMQAPHTDHPGTHMFPRNGVGFVINTDCQSNGTTNALNEVDIFTNYVENTLTLTDPCGSPTTMFTTAPDNANHFEIHISQNVIEFWGSDVGGANFRKMATFNNVNLPFTRGYVSFEHAQYFASKFGPTSTGTFHWHALGFDGPVVPADRTYQVPDALVPDDTGGLYSGGMNTGYVAPFSYTFNNVDLSSIKQPYLSFNVYYADNSQSINYTINGVQRTFISPVPGVSWQWTYAVIPLNESDLKPGTNTVVIENNGSCVTQCLLFANIDLDLVLQDNAPFTKFINPPVPCVTPYPGYTTVPCSPIPSPTSSPTPRPSVTPTPSPSATPSRLQGDVNGDGIIDLGDFSALSIDYGKPLSQAEFPGDDVDQDNSGVVDLGDVSKFIIIYQGIYGI